MWDDWSLHDDDPGPVLPPGVVVVTVAIAARHVDGGTGAVTAAPERATRRYPIAGAAAAYAFAAAMKRRYGRGNVWVELE